MSSALSALSRRDDGSDIAADLVAGDINTDDCDALLEMLLSRREAEKSIETDAYDAKESRGRRGQSTGSGGV